MRILIFNGEGGISAKAWFHKLETYFWLNPMYEEDIIKLAILHMEGVVWDWWQYEKRMQNHTPIQTFEKLCQRILERFDPRDVDECFGKFAELR